MGTTVVCAIVMEHIAYISHQSYIFKGTVRDNLLITRAVGVSREILVDFCEQEMKDGDVLLLCTDGLTNFVESDEMCDLTKDDMFYEFAERLVDRANKNGGGDNVTVVAVTY